MRAEVIVEIEFDGDFDNTEIEEQILQAVDEMTDFDAVDAFVEDVWEEEA